ncbi:MAG: hypothetical protein ACYTEQ_11370 [Planctomycetota bacterium]
MAGSGAEIDNTVTSYVEAGVAVNRARKQWLSEPNIKGTTGGFITGGGADSDTTVSFTTMVSIGNGACLSVVGNPSAPGDFKLRALNDIVARDKVTLKSGGAIVGLKANSRFETLEDLARVQVGSGATLLSVGDIDMSARGKGDIHVLAYAEAYGAGTYIRADTEAYVYPTNEIDIAGGTLIRADGDLNLSAGTGVNFDRDQYTLETRTDTYAGSAIPIDDLDARSILEYENRITIASGAVLETARGARLHAERLGFANMTARAKGVSWVSSLADALNGQAAEEIYNGTINTEAHGTVEVNGTVRTGIKRHKSLTLNWNQVTKTIQYTQTGDVTYSEIQEPLESDLLQELEHARAQLLIYEDTNQALADFYEGEIARLEALLAQQGLLEPSVVDEYGNPVLYSPVEQSVITVYVDPIWAEAGIIDVRADNLAGIGIFDAPGDASVIILNHSPAFLKLRGIVIPEKNGGLFFNGNEVSDNNVVDNVEINSLNTAGSGASFATNTPTAADEPVIEVENDFIAGVIGDDIYPWPDIVVLGDVDNLGGNATFQTHQAGDGDIIFRARVRAKNLTVIAGGTVFIDGVTAYTVGGEPYSLWSDATSGTIPDTDDTIYGGIAEASTSDVNTLLAQIPTEVSLYGDKIFINAEYLNINGIMQSGKADYSLNLGTATIDEIGDISPLQSGSIVLTTASTSDFIVRYNTATGQIEVDELRVSGGFIELEGHILNTGNGEIRLLGGYANINITNETSYDLVINRLDASQRGAGTLVIIDKAKDSVSDQTATIYQESNSGVIRTVDDGSDPVSSTVADTSIYTPAGGWRYGWSVGVETFERYYYYKGVSTWLGIDWLSPDPSSATHTDTEVVGEPTLSDEGPYYFESAIADNYTYDSDSFTLSQSELYLYKRRVTKTWWGKKTYHYYYVQESRIQTIHTHTIKANRNIDIKFIGNDQAQVSIDSDSDVLIKGPILNPSGTTTISSEGAIRQVGSAAYVGGRRIVLTAESGIGIGTPVSTNVADDPVYQYTTSITGDTKLTTGDRVKLASDYVGGGDGGSVYQYKGDPAELNLGTQNYSNTSLWQKVAHQPSLKATTTTGQVQITEIIGGLPVDQIVTGHDSLGSGDDVIVVSQGGIFVAQTFGGGWYEGLVQGGTISLTANGGDIGTSSRFVVLDSGALLKDAVTASAQGNIYLKEKENGGDLRLEKIEATGNVYIEVVSGGILDANQEAERDERTYQELLDGVWSDLQLTDGTGAQDKINEAIATFADIKEQEYRTYWVYRSTQPDPSVYDSAFEVTLSAAEEAYYRDKMGYDNAAIDALEAKRTAEYHTLHGQYGSYGDTYDPNYTYVLTSGELGAVTASIKVWSEEELLYAIGAGLLKPVSDTQVDIEDPNIVGLNVTLITFGGVGSAVGQKEIDVSSTPLSLTTDQRVALAAAERDDVVYLGPDISVTVNFADNGANDTITRIDGGSWLSDDFEVGMRIRLSGSSVNATGPDEFYEIGAVTTTVMTLKTGFELQDESGKSVTIAREIIDPLDRIAVGEQVSVTADFADNGANDTITRVDGGNWLNDGFLPGMHIRAQDNAEDAGEIYEIDIVTDTIITLTTSASLLTESGKAVIITPVVSDSMNPHANISTIIVNQREDVDVRATGEINIDAGASVYLGSEIDLNIDTVVAGDKVRIKGGQGVFNWAVGGATNVVSSDLILEAAELSIGTQQKPFYTDLFPTATITARAGTDIHIIERNGDINVETMFAKTGDIYLEAEGSIVDTLDNSYTNIAGNLVELTAVNGGIGEPGDYLDVDVAGAGTLTATAENTIWIAETFGNMNIKVIESQSGDVDLKANMAIFDALNTPDANVIGDSITLSAFLGTIGMSGNDLDINTGMGVLTSSSYLNIYIIETAGDLRINTVGTGADYTAFILGPERILNGIIDPTGSNVTSGKTRLFAGSDIGEASNPLTTEVGHIEAFSSEGSTWIINEGTLEVGGVSGSPGDPGMDAGGSIYLGATSPVTVTENMIADSEIVIVALDDDNDTDTDGTTTPLDKSDDADFLKVTDGITIHSQTSYVMLLAGDDLIIEAGATIRAQDYILMQGDYQGDEQGENPLPGTPPGGTVNADPGVGSTITINGTVDAPEILIYGERDDDCINIDIIEYDPDAEPRVGLFGYVQVFGGDGDDKITVNELHTRGEEMDLDGQAGTDRYTINTTGNSDYIINVFDSGAPDDGTDRLTINGTVDADTFLIRHNFVASLQATGLEDPRFEDTFERINYDENINARLRINGLEGNDEFYSDDNSSITTLDGGPGEDFFQIGQVFGEDRVAPFVASGDEIVTVETTLGFLSRGISFPMTVFGGDGNDNFSVYSNKALLKLFGEDGNDEFVVRAFVIKGTSDLASTDTEVNGGNGDDFIQYNINAPVSIDGGAGADTVVVLGTEIDDNFVITENGVQGAGLNIDFTAVEKLEVDGLEGNDHFFILSTSPDLVTTIIGGLGTDTFDVGGDVTEDIIALSIEGRSGFINHSLESDDPAYNGIFAEGIQLNVADEETGTVMVHDSGEMVVVEDDNDGIKQIDEEDFYTIKMAIAPPAEWTVAYITVSAAQAAFKDEQNGGKALEVSIDGINFAPALVLTFDSAVGGTIDPTAWAREQEIFVRGTFDEAEEGERTVVISHSVYSDNLDFDNLNVPNVEVKLIDDDKAGLIITETDLETQVLEGATAGDTYKISLTKEPVSGETVTVTLQFDDIGDSQISVSDPSSSTGRFDAVTCELTFDSTNWFQPFELKVTAVNDSVAENRLRAVITHIVSSTGGTSPEFANVLETPEIKVDIRDDDAAGLIVTETDGSTLVSEGNPDFYDIVLTCEPTDPVIVSITTDGQTIVSADSNLYGRFDDTADIPTVTFDDSNWNIPFTVKVEVDTDSSGQGSPVVQVFPAQPHSTTEIRGPLTIEGSVIPGKNRSLTPAVMLPSETDGPLPVPQIEVDEAQQTDALNIFNDGSVSNDEGVHDNPDYVSGLAAVYEVEVSEIDLSEFANISGLNMGGVFELDFGTPGNPDVRTFDGGVTYHGIEVVDILLGQGNDQFTVETTLNDVITVIQGGGNSLGAPLTTPFGDISGDYIVVNGGGGSNSPLIIFGETSQDGLFYDSTTASITGHGREFPNHGNDIIDAHMATQSVAIYGGRGSDTVYGSQAGDHIAGGSGDDTIYGQAGVDHIYGDSGFNIDLSLRISLANLAFDIDVLTVATVPGLADYALTNDPLAAGQDMIHGQGGNDIIIGDHGIIEQTYGTERILTTGSVERAYTSEPDNGVGDTIHGNDGIDRILGGNGGDNITGDVGDDIVIGDNGWVDYNTGDGDLTTVDLTQSTNPEIGAADTIEGNAGADIIIGGNNGDFLYGDDTSSSAGSADGRDIIIGDNGEILLTNGVIAQIRTTDTTNDTGGADIICGNYDEDIILGGLNGSPDVLEGDEGDNVLLGDNGELIYDQDGVLSTLDVVQTTHTNLGGSDIIYGRSGNDIILGGTGGDIIYGEEGNDLILGDFGRVEFEDVEIDGVPTDIAMFAETTDYSDSVGASDIIFGGPDEDVLVGGDDDDIIDGGTEDDLIFGDNVRLDRSGDNFSDFTSPRFKALLGTLIYDEDDNDLVDGSQDYLDPTGVPVWANWDIFIDDTAGFNYYGDDYIVGGAHDDTIFAQMGDDTIQGDGSVEVTSGDPETPSFVIPGFFVDETPVIFDVFEAITDGDDYIEGNGGNDTIYGGLGQDDIIGGSSNLFSLQDTEDPEHDRELRQDGSDIIFGGAGNRVGRNHMLTESNRQTIAPDENHARDADMILGDNGDIFRLVGTSGTNQGEFLTFNYDGYDEVLKIIPRAARLLDYTAGGPDYDAAGAATDIGGADEIHGESGDDFIYGMVSNDILFGDSEDDDLIGGWGHDWISGGTGQDGVLGDDGRIRTSRNGTAEPLYGIGDLAGELNRYIYTPGKIQQAIINVEGKLKKTGHLRLFNVDPNTAAQNPLFDPEYADDIIYGGWGDDFLHGGAGDDAVSGAEALQEFFDAPSNPGDVLGFNLSTGEFSTYDEYDPWRKIDGFLLNFDPDDRNDNGYQPTDLYNTTEYEPVMTDGDDAVFGDLGNDWLVGGTGRDHLYGGYGSDLLNVDDNHETNGGSNDAPDTHPSYEDIAYGGAGRDVLIANTGGDRLIDWCGEFNSYIVPFAPFGIATISRALQPQLMEYLYDLSESDGADPTRAADTGANPARNGEPEGELGLVKQQDFNWKDQTGAPDDPQAGNIAGGRRDVLRSANFNDGTGIMQTFFTDSGAWHVENGSLRVSAESLGGDAASVFHVDEMLPNYFEIQATITTDKPTSGWKANVYIIFDYYSPTDFKFAGLNASIDKMQMGHRTTEGWIVDTQTNMHIKPNKYYNMLVAVNGITVTLLVDGTEIFSHAFDPRIIDGWTYGLNSGMVGFGSDNSQGIFDNITVQKLPPEITFEGTEDFSDAVTDLDFVPAEGVWNVSGYRYGGTPSVDGDRAISFVDLGLGHGLEVASILELEATLNTQTTGGLFFDYYGPENFKFAAISAETNQVVIGHYTAKHGWSIDAAFNTTIEVGTDYNVRVSLKGNTVSVSVRESGVQNWQTMVGHVFNAVVVDGSFGLLSKNGGSSFDAVTVKTDDPAFRIEQESNNLTASIAPQDAVGTENALTYDALAAIVEAAIDRWTESLLVNEGSLALLDQVNFEIADLSGPTLGQTTGTTVLIDINAAGYGWFVDTTPYDDSEFDEYSGQLQANPSSPASGDIDLLTVVMHELGHILGYDDVVSEEYPNNLMSATLDADVRRLYTEEPTTLQLDGQIVLGCSFDSLLNKGECGPGQKKKCRLL